MNVIRAEVMGMCFGVRDALRDIEAVADPEAVTIHGELVHNEVVLNDLHGRGFRMTAEHQRREIPRTPLVLITAHGVSEKERQRLTGAGKQLLDTTCPLVTRVHQAAVKLRDEGYHVLVIGKRGHVEVQGIIEDLTSYEVLQGADEVRTYPHPRLGVVCQTTSPARLVREVHEAVVARNPGAEVNFQDTVCLPTKDHQKALERLLGQVDAVVVVGGRNSNNTRELVRRCAEAGVPAHHVQGATDLDPAWFEGCRTVGLTAGTSTLDNTIEEVYQALVRLPGPSLTRQESLKEAFLAGASSW